jgi:hypothetical protein
MREESMRASIAVLVVIAFAEVGCDVVAGRNVRAGRKEFSEDTGCEQSESKATNLGKVDAANPNVVGANTVEVSGCGQTRRYVCAVLDTGGGGSDVVCEKSK